MEKIETPWFIYKKPQVTSAIDHLFGYNFWWN